MASDINNIPQRVRTTVYNPTEDQWGYQTATGVNSRAGYTAAVDPSVIPYGRYFQLLNEDDTPWNDPYGNNGIRQAVDTGSAVKSRKASGGNEPVIDLFTEDDVMEHQSKIGNYAKFKLLPEDFDPNKTDKVDGQNVDQSQEQRPYLGDYEFDNIIKDKGFNELPTQSKLDMYRDWLRDYEGKISKEDPEYTPEEFLKYKKELSPLISSYLKGKDDKIDLTDDDKPYDFSLRGESKLDKFRIKDAGNKDFQRTLNIAEASGDLTPQERDALQGKIEAEQEDSVRADSVNIGQYLFKEGKVDSVRAGAEQALEWYNSDKTEDQEKFNRLAQATVEGTGETSGFLGSVGRGLVRGSKQVAAMTVGATELAANAVGADDLAQSLAEGKRLKQAQVDAINQPLSFKDAEGTLNKVGAGITQGAGAVSELVPYMGAAAAGATILAPVTGVSAGLFLPSMALAAGDYYQGKGNELGALGFGAVSGVIDLGLGLPSRLAKTAFKGVEGNLGRQVAMGIKNLGKEVAEASAKGVMKSLPVTALKNTAGEIVQELGQETLGIINERGYAGLDPTKFDQQDVDRLKDTAIQTAVGILPISIGGTAMARRINRDLTGRVARINQAAAEYTNVRSQAIDAGLSPEEANNLVLGSTALEKKLEDLGVTKQEDKIAIINEMVKQEGFNFESALEKVAQQRLVDAENEAKAQQAVEQQAKTDFEILSKKAENSTKMNLVAAKEQVATLQAKFDLDKSQETAMQLNQAKFAEKKIAEQLNKKTYLKSVTEIADYVTKANKVQFEKINESKQSISDYLDKVGISKSGVKIVNSVEAAIIQMRNSPQGIDPDLIGKYNDLVEKTKSFTDISGVTSEDLETFLNATTSRKWSPAFTVGKDVYFVADPARQGDSASFIRQYYAHEKAHVYMNGVKSLMSPEGWQSVMNKIDSYMGMDSPELTDFDKWLTEAKNVNGRAGLAEAYTKRYNPELAKNISLRDMIVEELFTNYIEYATQKTDRQKTRFFQKIQGVADSVATLAGINDVETLNKVEGNVPLLNNLVKAAPDLVILDWIDNSYSDKDIKSNKPIKDLRDIIFSEKFNDALSKKNEEGKDQAALNKQYLKTLDDIKVSEEKLISKRDALQKSLDRKIVGEQKALSSLNREFDSELRKRENQIEAERKKLQKEYEDEVSVYDSLNEQLNELKLNIQQPSSIAPAKQEVINKIQELRKKQGIKNLKKTAVDREVQTEEDVSTAQVANEVSQSSVGESSKLAGESGAYSGGLTISEGEALKKAENSLEAIRRVEDMTAMDDVLFETEGQGMSREEFMAQREIAKQQVLDYYNNLEVKYALPERITPEQDAAYLDAVKRYRDGDESALIEIQKMVDGAASKVGYKERGWHWSRNGKFTFWDTNKSNYPAFYMTRSESIAKNMMGSKGGVVIPLFLKSINPAKEGQQIISSSFLAKEVVSQLKSLGFDSAVGGRDFKLGEEIAVFDPSQIKSADPITYDDQGNVMPLSQRFNQESNDIRYALPEGQLDHNDQIYIDNTEYDNYGKALEELTELAKEDPNAALKAIDDVREDYGFEPIRYALPENRNSPDWIQKSPKIVKDLLTDIGWASGDIRSKIMQSNWDRQSLISMGKAQSLAWQRDMTTWSDKNRAMMNRIGWKYNEDGTVNFLDPLNFEKAKDITKAIAGEKVTSPLSKEEQLAVKELRDLFDRYGQMMVANGMMTQHQLDVNRKLGGYVPYYFDNSAKGRTTPTQPISMLDKKYGRDARSVLRGFNIMTGSKENQEFVETFATKEEALAFRNQLIKKEQALPENEPRNAYWVTDHVSVTEMLENDRSEDGSKDYTDFVFNPAVIVPRYIAEVTSDIAKHKFLSDVYDGLVQTNQIMDAEQWKSLDRTEQQKWDRIDNKDSMLGSGVKQYGKLAGMFIPVEAHEFVTQTFDPREMNSWFETYKTGMDLWAMAKTAYSASTFMANVFSTTLMAPTLGINPKDTKLLFKALKIAKDHSFSGGNSPIIMDLIEAGVVSRHTDVNELSDLLQELEPVISNKIANGEEVNIITELAKKIKDKYSKTKLAAKEINNKVLAAYGLVDDVIKVAAYLKRIENGDTKEQAKNYISRYGINYNQVPRNKTMTAFRYGFNRFWSFQHQLFKVVKNIIEDAYKGSPLTGKKEYSKLGYLVGLTAFPWILNAIGMAIGDPTDEEKEDIAAKDELTAVLPFLPMGLRGKSYIDPILEKTGIKSALGLEKNYLLKWNRYIPTLDMLGFRFTDAMVRGNGDKITSGIRSLITGNPLAKTVFQLATNMNTYTGAQITPQGAPAGVWAGNQGALVLKEIAPSILTNNWLALDQKYKGINQKRELPAALLKANAGIDLEVVQPNDYENAQIYYERAGIAKEQQAKVWDTYKNSLVKDWKSAIKNGDNEEAWEAEQKIKELAVDEQGNPLSGKALARFQYTPKELRELYNNSTPLRMFGRSKADQMKAAKSVIGRGGFSGESLKESLDVHKQAGDNLRSYLQARQQYAREAR